jgi:hypothetical protein
MAGFKINCSNASTILLVIILVLVVVCILTKSSVESFRRRGSRGKNKKSDNQKDKGWCRQKYVCNTNNKCQRTFCSTNCPSKCGDVEAAAKAAAKAAKAKAAKAKAAAKAAKAAKAEAPFPTTTFVEKSWKDADYVKELFNNILDLKTNTKCTKDEKGCEAFGQNGVCEEPKCIWINTEKDTIIKSSIPIWNNKDVRQYVESIETINKIQTIIDNNSVDGVVKYFETLDDGRVTKNTIESIISAMYMYMYIKGLK